MNLWKQANVEDVGVEWDPLGFFRIQFLYFLVNNNETGPQPPQQGVVNSWRR